MKTSICNYENLDVIMRMPRPAQAGLPPWPHKHPTAPPALHRQKCYWVPGKNAGKCFAKYTIVLGIWLCCRGEESPVSAKPEHSLGALWVWRRAQPAHQPSRAVLASPAQGLQGQSHTIMHFEDRGRNINLFTLKEKKEHCQHVFTVFTWKKKKTKTQQQKPTTKK